MTRSVLRSRNEQRKLLVASPSVSTPVRTSLHPILRLQQTAGNRAVTRLHHGGFLQAKIALSAPDDVYEQEADRIAAGVMRQIGGGTGTPKPAAPWIQRQSEEEEEEELIQPRREIPFSAVQRQEEDELLWLRRAVPVPPVQRQEEEEELLQPHRGETSPAPPRQALAEGDHNPRSGSVSERARASAPSAAPEPSSPALTGALESQLADGRGGGRTLDRGLRAEYEGAFGFDFGRVRIHTGTPADQLAGQIHAEAFTNEGDIYFRAGRYQPGTEDGRFLLAHELAHVIQQGAAASQWAINHSYAEEVTFE